LINQMVTTARTGDPARVWPVSAPRAAGMSLLRKILLNPAMRPIWLIVVLLVLWDLAFDLQDSRT